MKHRMIRGRTLEDEGLKSLLTSVEGIGKLLAGNRCLVCIFQQFFRLAVALLPTVLCSIKRLRQVNLMLAWY